MTWAPPLYRAFELLFLLSPLELEPGKSVGIPGRSNPEDRRGSFPYEACAGQPIRMLSPILTPGAFEPQLIYVPVPVDCARGPGLMPTVPLRFNGCFIISWSLSAPEASRYGWQGPYG